MKSGDVLAHYVFKFPNGIVVNQDDYPDLSKYDERFKKGRWVSEGFNSVGMEVFHLEFPPVKVTFQTETDSVTYLSDKIPEVTALPEIVPKEGMVGRWAIPEVLVEDVCITPTYDIAQFKIQFVDRFGTRVVPFSVKRRPKFPEVRAVKGYKGRWECDEIEYRDMTINALYEPISITFCHDGKRETQVWPDICCPEMEDKPGYMRKWKVPSEVGSVDIILVPDETPIVYYLKIHMGEVVTSRPFTMESKPKLPSIPYKPGYKAKWTGFDVSIPENQEAWLVYTPIKVRFHTPEGVEEYEYDEKIDVSVTNPIMPPSLNGYVWPEYRIKDEDIDLYPEKRMDFALFYVNGSLRFCVPFTITDRHYIDEMLNHPTVPKFKRRFGVWVQQESDEDGLEIYVADYSVQAPAVPRESTSFEWDLEKVVDYVVENGLFFDLDGVSHNLLSERYSELTGITAKGLDSLRSLPLLKWLNREGIPYSDKVHGHEIIVGTKSNQIRLSGSFWIGYKKDFDPALEFLESFDVYFREPKRSRIIRGLPGRYLVSNAMLERDEDEYEVLEDIFPIHRMIPSMHKPYSSYSKMNIIPKRSSPTSHEIDEAMRSVNRVIDVFNVTTHTEFVFQIIDSLGNDVGIVRYDGSEEELEIPSKVMLSEDDPTYYTVRKIVSEAFKDNSSLISIMIPDTIDEVGDHAFDGCSNLVNVVGCRGVKVVGNDVFNGCYSIQRNELLDSDTGSDENPIDGIGKEDESEDDSDPFDLFIESLDGFERLYLTYLCAGRNTEGILTDHRKKASIVELGINQKFFDYFDDELVDDSEVDEEYLDQLVLKLEDYE